MTAPSSPVQSGPASDVSTTAAEEVAANAARLGLTWKLRPGTVVSGNDVTIVSVLLDGDDQPINAYSLVGTIGPDQRVDCILVPPSGIYVVGYQGLAPTQSAAVARATTSGIIATTSGVVELNIPQLAIANASVATDQLYSFSGSIATNGGAAASSYLFRWRKGAALTGSLIAAFIYLPGGTGFDDTKAFDAPWRPGISDVDSYFLSVQQQAGAGTLSIYGKHATNLQQSYARLEHVGNYVAGGSFVTDS